MRHVLVSLIAAAAVSTPAFAQDATTTTTVQEPTVPATTAVPATPGAEVAQPADADAAVTAMPAPAPETVPVPAPVQQASDPTTLQVLNVLENVCRPLVAGGDPAEVSKPLGFRKKKNTFVMALGKPQQIILVPSATNRNVCNLEVDHAIGGDKDLTIGLHNWAMARGYTLYRNDEYTTDLKRHTRSWELTKDGKSEALVLVTEFKPDGSSVGRKTDHSTVMFSVQ
ncbi:MAG TPA: hypothetical protein VF138_12900 [Caulobacteraceae bacterium]